MNRPTVVHWFRKGLRLHDNPSLLSSLDKVDGKYCELRPVFVLDPWFVQNANVGPNRWRFLAECLQDLDNSLKKLGLRLFVLRGKPLEVFENIFKTWNVRKLTFETDIEPYAKERDEAVKKLAAKHKVEVVTAPSHTLYDLELIRKANGGSAPLTYQKFTSVVGKLGLPELPKNAPASIPDACKTSFSPTEFMVPTLEELKFNISLLGPHLYPGGETESLQRLDKYASKHEWVCKFSKPDTAPNTLEPSTTVLSPYLKFGCLSPRLMYHRIHQVIMGRKHTDPPTSLIGQLLWREFYYTCGAFIANFDRMEGNSVCKQIPWSRNEQYLSAWTNAKTGYPFIDAIMTQLRTEGWIHHLARHAVACFLTRGDLWCHWEEGQRVFEELLLDADWALNAGNWLWLSASAFFHQYYRVYGPVSFGKKTDKNGDYIKKYLPILKKYPAEYIYEPWKAPLSVQRAAGCIIGQDYPRPIVDHEVAMKENLAKMNAAYKKPEKPDQGGGKRKRTSPADSSRPSKKLNAYFTKK